MAKSELSKLGVKDSEQLDRIKENYNGLNRVYKKTDEKRRTSLKDEINNVKGKLNRENKTLNKVKHKEHKHDENIRNR